MPFDPDKPYNDLPLLPPKAGLESKAAYAPFGTNVR
jgi:hypothetical protein